MSPSLQRVFIFLLAAVVSASPALAANTVYISEFMALNDGALLDEDQDASDWIELYNAGAAPVNLAGWRLTDDRANFGRWAFPSTNLAAGGYLVVFASGKDRAVAGAELHANFRLSGAGGYLALIEADGMTVAHEYAPVYPTQFKGVAYGLSVTVSNLALIARRAVAKWRVPRSVTDYPADWPAVEFDDSAWTEGTVGLGFDRGGTNVTSGAVTNLALGKTTTQSSTLDFVYASGNAVDGDINTFTHTLAGMNTPATWEVDLGTNYSLSRIVLWNRVSCCGSRLRDITVRVLSANGAATNFVSAWLNPENALESPDNLTLDLEALTGGPVAGGRVRVTRTPDPDLSGTGGVGNSDEFDVLSLAEVQVFGNSLVPRVADWLETDIGAAMGSSNATVLARLPFTLREAATPALDRLALSLRYNDGFVAYLNGVEVARRNAPAVLDWNATATEKLAATEREEMDLSTALGSLREGQNVLAIQALNVAADDATLLILPELTASSTRLSSPRYFTAPTPGAANSDGWLGLVTKPLFSVDSGVFTAPFTLELTTATDGAEIRYTTNGTPPDTLNGLVYSGPIAVDRTTPLRAAAFRAGWAPSAVETRSYVFVTSVITQNLASAISEGYPAQWAGLAADYNLDSRITAVGAEAMTDALRSLPSVFITTTISNLFDESDGIYAYPDSHGVAWERPVSLEWVGTNQVSEFRVDCGLRIQGGYFRYSGVTHKHSFRALFKETYGASKLRHRVFEESGAAESFDTLVFRAGANDGYSWGDAGATVQFIRDEFGRRLQLAMGEAAPHGRFVHLYLNGLYWGLYNVAERPNEDFSASYYGGDAAAWDANNAGDVKSGNSDAWNQFTQLASQTTTLAQYQKLQGKAVDGTRNPASPVYLDKTNYIDYMILNMWGGNWDWPNKNFWFGRDSSTNSTGFKFYTWDFENTMGNNRERSPLTMEAPRPDIAAAWVGEPHYYLKNLSEYQLDFADRVQRWFFQDGVLSPASLIERYRQLAAQVESAVLVESARWGDDTTATPRTLAQWRAERDWILNTYLPQRGVIVLRQFQSAGLYPAISAPVFSQYGGSVPADFHLTLTHTNSGGAIYFTTNGADPRTIGTGVLAAAAQLYLAPLVVTVPTQVRARALSGTQWSALVEAMFYPTQDWSRLVVSELMYHAPDWGSTNGNEYDFIELFNTGTNRLCLDGLKFTAGIGFAFTNGTRLGAGQDFLLARNSEALAAKYPGVAVNGVFTGNLDNGGETLTLVDALDTVVFSFTYNDKASWPTAADGAGYSLVWKNPSFSANANDGASWAASATLGGTPGMGAVAAPVIDTVEWVRSPALAIRLRFKAAAGRAYTVQYCDQLNQGQWQVLAAVAATDEGRTVEIVDSLYTGSASRYYRLTSPLFGK
jgi:hypothetical protein